MLIALRLAATLDRVKRAQIDPGATPPHDAGQGGDAMAEIVFAAGVPHAPGLVGLFHTAPEGAQSVVRHTFKTLADELKTARPDVLIVFANDHLANSKVSAYPDFLLGMAAEHRGPYEWFKPWIGCEDYTVKGSPGVAAALFNGMSRRGIRMFAQNENLKFDDNISVPVLLTHFARMGIPMV